MKDKALVLDRFLQADAKRYAYGCTKYAESLSGAIRIDGYIDDYAEKETFLDKPILKFEDLPKNAIVVSTVTGIKPQTVMRKIYAKGFLGLDYYFLYRNSGLALLEIDYLESRYEDILENHEKYEWIFSLLSDDESKETFEKIVQFRKTYDINYLEGFKYREDEQYLEDFLNISPNEEVFVDVGAYDGYTTFSFEEKYGCFKSVIIVEPDKSNISKVKSRLEACNDIRYVNKGLSDRRQVVSFDSNGSSSKILKKGNSYIEVDLLDNILDGQNVSFIKMDIEGMEIPAINGSRLTILNNHPKLAISAYHKENDFWAIPEAVLSIRQDYDIYLRHYTEGLTESVMFFIPK